MSSADVFGFKVVASEHVPREQVVVLAGPVEPQDQDPDETYIHGFPVKGMRVLELQEEARNPSTP